MIKRIDGKIIFNVSDNLDNYTQKNNEYTEKLANRKVNWATVCNCTSIAMALYYNGYKFPTAESDKFPQPVDRLTKFIMESKEVDAYYKDHMPAMYADYKKGLKDCYTPNEIHSCLELGTNLWMGTTCDTFRMDVSLSELKKILIVDNMATVISGKFNKYNHIVCLVGASYSETEELDKALDSGNMDLFLSTQPIDFIVDDPYGAVCIGHPELPGNDIHIPYLDFINEIKPLGNPSIKWAHVFKKPAAIV